MTEAVAVVKSVESVGVKVTFRVWLPAVRTVPEAGGISIYERDACVRANLETNLLLLGDGMRHGGCQPDQIADRDAVRLNPHFSGFGTARFEQVAHHRSQLVYALQNGLEVVALFGTDLTGQAVQQDGDKLVNAGQRRAQFVRNMRQELVFELQLLLAAHLQGTQQRLAFDGIAHGPIQPTAGDGALHQIVLHALMQGLHRQPFVILSRQNDDGYTGRFLQHLAKSFRTLAIRQVEIQQDHRGGFFLE